MEKGSFALTGVVLLGVFAVAGCAAVPPPAPAVAPLVAETRTTGAVVLGAPVTQADGPRTTIPADETK